MDYYVFPVCSSCNDIYEMEVANVLQAKAYDLNDKEKVSIIKNWLGREGLQFIQSLTDTGNEAH